MSRRSRPSPIFNCHNLRVSELITNQLELLCKRCRISLTIEFADGVAVQIGLTVKLVDAYNHTITAENEKIHQVDTINAVYA